MLFVNKDLRGYDQQIPLHKFWFKSQSHVQFDELRLGGESIQCNTTCV